MPIKPDKKKHTSDITNARQKKRRKAKSSSELAGVSKTVEKYFPNIQSENYKRRIVDIRVLCDS